MMSPVFLVRDPELYKKIAIKEFDSFADHHFIIEPHMDSMMGNSLFLKRGETWREMRTTLSPAFTGSKMRHMFELIRECAIQSCDSLSEQSNHIEMSDFFSRFANDVIASIAFGSKLNSFEDRTNDFFQAAGRLHDLMSLGTLVRIMALRTVPWFMKMFDIEVIGGQLRRHFTELLLNNMKTRREQNIVRPDLIDTLLHAKRKNKAGVDNADKESSWSDVEIVSQAFFFFLGGLDTIMWTLVAFSYELTRHPDIQQRLIDEVDATNESLNGADVTYDALKKMKYMEMVYNEVLRLHSPAAAIDRLCTKDFTLTDGDLNIKFVKGDVLCIPTYGYHYNPEYFPDPNKFDPERFSDENKVNINSAHYIPFGVGPRQCIANRLARMELKILIFYLLSNFTFNVSPKTEIPMTVKSSFFGLAPAHGLHLLLEKRR